MKRLTVLGCPSLAQLLSGSNAMAAVGIVPMSDAELSRYDLNHNRKIDPGREQSLLIAHLNNPVLRAYDWKDLDGKLSAVEIADIERNAVPQIPKALATAEIEEIETDLNFGVSRTIAFLVKPEAGPPKEEKEQQLFLRSERINASVYEKNLGRAASDGAQIDVRYDPAEGLTDFSLSGALSYVIRDRDPKGGLGYIPGHTYLSGYGFMPFLEFDYRKKSNEDEPERSKLVGGVSMQSVLYDGPLFGTQIFQVNPSYQTDFDFEARIYSAQAAWQPYNVNIGLGSYIPVTYLPGVWFTWSATADADYRFVDQSGHTGLTDNTDYLWLGGILQAKFKIAPTAEWEDRLFVTAKLAFHEDVINDIEATLFSVGVSYNLDTKGFSSVNLSYQTGRDYQTGDTTDEVRLGLGIKF